MNIRKLFVCILFATGIYSFVSCSNKPQEVPGPFELTFEKSVVFMSDSYVVDGKHRVKPRCEKSPVVFARIALNKQYTVELTCSSFISPGIYLQVIDEKSKQPIILGEANADAGTSWDLRSRLTKDESGRVSIDTLSLQSEGDIYDESRPIACKVYANTLVANGDSAGLIVNTLSAPKKDFSPASFEKPIHVDTICLTSEGAWK